MRELSMHILDLAQNSIVAGASLIYIKVNADSVRDSLEIEIADNGKGMDAEFAANVIDPFVTTRTTRRVGLGIPMLAQAARACDGDLIVQSQPGKGTTVRAWFGLSHIDRAPLGDMTATIVSLVAANPQIDIVYMQSADGAAFTVDTRTIRQELDGVPLNEQAVLVWLRDYIRDGIGFWNE